MNQFTKRKGNNKERKMQVLGGPKADQSFEKKPCVYMKFGTDLYIDSSINLAIIFILAKPALTVECVLLSIHRIINVHFIQKPGGSKH